jgi:hypothetical protein
MEPANSYFIKNKEHFINLLNGTKYYYELFIDNVSKGRWLKSNRKFPVDTNILLATNLYNEKIKEIEECIKLSGNRKIDETLILNKCDFI